MPHHRFSSQTLDLFEHVPTSDAEPQTSPAKQPASDLVSWSDARLARLLKDLLEELQERVTKAGKRQDRPELNQAIEVAASMLESLVQRPVRPAKRRQGSMAAEPLQPVHEAKRKAIRAALAAGVAPGQVAKHFGLPLSAVRQILAEAA
jgi:hypothetical protein